MALALSLLFHMGLILWLSTISSEKDITKTIKQNITVTISTKESAKTIVSLPEKNSTKPDKAKFLAEQDQRSDHEQVATPRAFKKTSGAQKHQKARNDFKKPHKPSANKKHINDPLGIRTPPSFNNSMPSDEYVPGIDEGEKTTLNAWQYRHASFFNRIRDAVAQNWSPNSQIYRYDPDGSMLGHLDRITVMEVTIDKQGSLTALYIAHSSGINYLDDEALRSFKQAAPFLYPPSELFLENTQFTFKFSFFVQVNRGLKLDFDWDSKI